MHRKKTVNYLIFVVIIEKIAKFGGNLLGKECVVW